MTLTYAELFIGGEWVEPSDGNRLDVFNPATETQIGSVPQAAVEDVRRVIVAARDAFDHGPWPRLKPSERSAMMLRFAEVLERRKQEIIELNIAEVGSTRAAATAAQVQVPLDHFIDMAQRVLPGYPFEVGMLPTTGRTLGQGVVLHEPIGVASLITPFNYPFMLNLIKLAPAMAAGCTSILKPSPLTPLESFLLAEVAQEADLPPGVLNVVTGDVDAAIELTSDPGIDLVSFTGSTDVGRQVLSQASTTLKRVVLELGGKSASIILADADLDRVARDVVTSLITQCGQTCTRLSRTLVDRTVFDDLQHKVAALLEDVRVGDPRDPATTMGPLISAGQRDHVEQAIAGALAEGAAIAFGGERPDDLDAGYFMQPTMLVDVSNDMQIARREVFGPVGVMIPFDGEDDAIRIANSSDFGLGGGVWSADPTRAYHVAKRLRTGMVRVNGGGGSPNPTGPFGGYKQSGLGREFGAAGLAEFLETKSVSWPISGG